MNTPDIPYTTLNRMREHSPCKTVWNALLKELNKTQADDEPLSYLYLASLAEAGKEVLSVGDVLWFCKAEPKYYEIWRLCAVKFAREVQHLMKDPRSLKALDVAEAYVNGKASLQELKEAARSAWKALREIELLDVGAKVRAAAWTAWATAEASAWAAAREAARAAAWEAARESERELAWEAAYADARTKQLKIFKQMVS